MRHQQLAVKCSHLSLIWLLAQKDFLFVATGLLSGQSPGCQRYRGFKMSQQRTGRCFFIYRTTTFGYIHLIFLAAANHAATQPTWSVPTSTGTNRCERSTLGLCSVYRLLDLNIKSKKKNKWTSTLVAEELVASPPPPQFLNSAAGVLFQYKRGSLESVSLIAVQVRTYARRKPFTCYELKATFIAANWEQLSGGKHKETEQSETLGSKEKPHYYVFAIE